jgi:hypothetical protein
MWPPRRSPYPPAARYEHVVARSLRYDTEELVIDAQGPGFSFARVVFRAVAGFRVLDERDLTEFWNEYHQGNGWLYEVHEGGWLELEVGRGRFFHEFYENLREYLGVCDQCVSVLSMEVPEIVDVGADPEGA